MLSSKYIWKKYEKILKYNMEEWIIVSDYDSSLTCGKLFTLIQLQDAYGNVVYECCTAGK